MLRASRYGSRAAARIVARHPAISLFAASVKGLRCADVLMQEKRERTQALPEGRETLEKFSTDATVLRSRVGREAAVWLLRGVRNVACQWIEELLHRPLRWVHEPSPQVPH